eukprot:TRINITY_DN25781_c0_g1_i1.p1 TRINITY_DN25781_c0_g1~~TRINITY_DN25781_c0_g1_i1.p1  ORF type:complete len:377 (+),score=44.89 TRINITY_DN25781_c0_g1_i1:29-1132(+)
MHIRNRHRDYLDYRDLASRQTSLKPFVFVNAWGGASIDYSNQEALQELTRCLLADFYGVVGWQIPAGYLCPPVPQRADYIHVVADLLQITHDDASLSPARGQGICGLDIGTGAGCIYCLLGAREYGWNFIGSDIDQESLDSAAAILARNSMETQIQLRLQADSTRMLKGVLHRGESIAFCVCNPPFHESLEHARSAASAKWRRLGRSDELEDGKNYSGKETELCCEGGEVGFILRLADESAKPRFRDACVWFTTLVSRESSVEPVRRRLAELGAKRYGYEISQGKNTKWVVAWSFLRRADREKRLRQMAESADERGTSAAGHRKRSTAVDENVETCQADVGARASKKLKTKSHRSGASGNGQTGDQA